MTLCIKKAPKIWGIIKQLNINNYVLKMSDRTNNRRSTLNDALVCSLHYCGLLFRHLCVTYRNVLLATLSLAILCGLLLVPPSLAQTEIPLTTSGIRTSIGPVVKGGVYNYAPSVMLDGVYRMWWCGSDRTYPGDHIFYAESSSLDGPFHARGSSAPYQIVFSPNKEATAFDKVHTCDPSVIRVNGTYYMYYGGWNSVRVDAEGITKIGLATSTDGINWTRANNGNPIILPANKKLDGNPYGAGQPSISYLNGMFYLMYTDTTGADSLDKIYGGGGQYVLRSPDPTFQSEVEELTPNGFVTKTEENHTGYQQNYWVSVDMQFSDALNAWIVAHNNGPRLSLSFYPPDFSTKIYNDVQLSTSTVEGPGIVSRPDKHSVVSSTGQCSTLPIDVINATARNFPRRSPTDLAHIGIDVSAGMNCENMRPSQVANIYEGYGIKAAGLPLTFVVSGTRLQADSIRSIQFLTKNFVEVTPEIFHAIPYGASLKTGAPVIGATGQPAAFLLNSAKWPVNGIKIIRDNKSSIKMVPLAEYDSYPTKYPLYLVQ
ncbi:family 43 glycosylhydrolase [Photorhabdus caribbeanensis]|uniref:family 43 glycosylhydrolase n=1 Tax=Photorhabdus caribbeanensis TaxID=1004165 RepID=UPI001BD384F7|nr:family 43 glycosylhydrolase [Photorhabdus caribbeanensis]MBS9422444.1 hypothetical protein [Photorhabdus caribbeanensis]